MATSFQLHDNLEDEGEVELKGFGVHGFDVICNPFHQPAKKLMSV